jgi:hypothetical protein
MTFNNGSATSTGCTTTLLVFGFLVFLGSSTTSILILVAGTALFVDLAFDFPDIITID